jgi:hypothetical protein
VAGRGLFLAPPKSDAGKRLVAIPSVMLSDVRSRLDNLTQPEADALLFTSPTGKLLRHGNFRRRVWLPALAASGVEIHLHDYADLCVMPTSGRTSCSAVVNGLNLSA